MNPQWGVVQKRVGGPCGTCTRWQLLNLVVRKERPDLADLGEQLVEQQNGFKIKMKELEDNILYKLATAEGGVPPEQP